MGYESGKTYWIVPQNNTGVALSVYGNTQVSENRNVVVWSKQDIADQLWRVDVESGYARIKSTINTAYALNIWLGSSNYGNCDIHTWSGNLEDSKINFRTVDASQNLYLIQNYRNNADNDLYLTAESTASGANVKWTGRNTGLNQVWKLIEKSDGGGEPGGGGGGAGPYGDYVYPTVCRELSQGYSYDHPAVDIRDRAADHEIYAFADGVVSFVQDNNNPDPGSGMWTMGNCIAINHNNPITTKSGRYARTIYMHMKDAPTLVPGDHVVKGQRIGTIGTTGQSSGNHLHFSVSTGDASTLAPGSYGWISISALPDFDPITILPEYHMS